MVSAALVTVAVRYGLGLDLFDIQNPNDQLNALKYLTIAPNFSILSVAVGKVSIVLLLKRVMGMAAKRWHLIILLVVAFISFCLSIASVVVVLGFCTPTARIWDKTVKGTCINPMVQLGVGLSQACELLQLLHLIWHREDRVLTVQSVQCFRRLGSRFIPNGPLLEPAHETSAQNWPYDGHGRRYFWRSNYQL